MRNNKTKKQVIKTCFFGAGDVTRTHDLMKHCPKGKLRIPTQSVGFAEDVAKRI